MKFRWQNLNERPRARADRFSPAPTGLPIHGRCWLGPDDDDDDDDDGPGYPTSLRLEWHVLSTRCALALEVDPHDEDHLKLHFGLPPVDLYLSLTDRRLGKLLERIVKQPSDMGNNYSGRELSLRIHDWSLWWKLWVDTSGWTHERPKWRDGNVNFPDTLLGKFKHSERLLERRDIEIRMPEGVYKGVCEMKEGTWKRPRWPFPVHVVRAHIDMTQPIPIPGKGENSWDCGEDATHGSTFPARNVADAIGKLTGDILNTRERRAGRNWQPARKQQAS